MPIVMRYALALPALVACASPGTPPGGPVDAEAPQIVDIAPDSGATSTTPREVVFRFDEVVSERPSGAQSLAALVQISPREGDPRVEWNRDEIAVRPRRGWRPNTAYTVTLLPGISDLRGNTRNTGAVMIFATGASIPAGRIRGTLFNWVEARVVPRGLVEARAVADTNVVYVTSTDSAGSFALTNLPAARYTIRAIVDDNNNRALDPREMWDSAEVNLSDTATLELLAFARDSTGARLTSVDLRDSVTLDLQFDNAIPLAPPVAATSIRVRASDSTDVPILSVTFPPVDTASAGRRRPSRPSPVRILVVRLARPLRARTEYRVRVTDIRNVMGISRTSERTFTVSAAAPQASPPSAPPAAPVPIRR